MTMSSVLITGAGRGIGKALVERFALEGWHVHACMRAPQKTANTLEESVRARICTHRLDVTDDTHIASLSQSLEHVSLDVVINNAGVFGPRPAFGRHRCTDFRKVLHVNAVAPLLVAEACCEALSKSSRPVLANVSSILGSIGSAGSGDYPYCVSKAALNMMTRKMAADLASRNILTVALHPGWVRTDMGGERAPLSTSESAQGIHEVISNLRPEQNGSFLDYRGKKIPW